VFSMFAVLNLLMAYQTESNRPNLQHMQPGACMCLLCGALVYRICTPQS
jgi:hypothetical protein